MLGFNHSPHTTYDYLWMDGQTDHIQNHSK